MDSRIDSERRTMSNIATSLAMVGDVAGLIGSLTQRSNFGFQASVNPMQLLVKIIKAFKGEDGLQGTLIEMLSRIITTVCSTSFDIAVKGILLTNLKKMVSCSLDPRIPNEYRLGNTNHEGILVNSDSIDFFKKLDISPLSEVGRNKYFGTEGIESVGMLAMPMDFDAFLWFVMHCGTFQSAADYDTLFEAENSQYLRERLDEEDITTHPITILTPQVVIMKDSDLDMNIVQGMTFSSNTVASGMIAMCVDVEFENNRPKMATIIPIAQNVHSVNWWGDPSFNTIFKDKVKKENCKPILNLEFLQPGSLDQDKYPSRGLVNRAFRVSVLQQPRNMKDCINDSGNQDMQNGHYTHPLASDAAMEDKRTLVPMYNGLTVYEFNYDYVMSLKLFDAKTLVSDLLEALYGYKVGVGFGFTHTVEEEKIAELIKSISLETEDVENDCFYSFSNSRYDSMLKRSEKIKAMGLKFATEIPKERLDELNQLITHIGEEEVSGHTGFTSAVTMALTRGFFDGAAEATDEWKFDGVRFLYDTMEFLTMVIMEHILSPKVMMAFEVNRQLMGGEWQPLSFSDVLAQMHNVVRSVLYEVRDMIVAELLKYVLELLDPIIKAMQDMILKEAAEEYISIIRAIIEECPFIWFNLFSGGEPSETTIPDVNYADITKVRSENNEKPININC